MTKIPKFKNEKEEAKFWDTHNPFIYMSELEACKKLKFPKPSKRKETIKTLLLSNELKHPVYGRFKLVKMLDDVIAEADKLKAEIAKLKKRVSK